jgi:hypothetical protein
LERKQQYIKIGKSARHEKKNFPISSGDEIEKTEELGI